MATTPPATSRRPQRPPRFSKPEWDLLNELTGGDVTVTVDGRDIEVALTGYDKDRIHLVLTRSTRGSIINPAGGDIVFLDAYFTDTDDGPIIPAIADTITDLGWAAAHLLEDLTRRHNPPVTLRRALRVVTAAAGTTPTPAQSS